MAVSAEHRSKFAALHRQCWHLHMSEKFSSGTKNNQTKKKKTKKNFHHIIYMATPWQKKPPAPGIMKFTFLGHHYFLLSLLIFAQNINWEDFWKNNAFSLWLGSRLIVSCQPLPRRSWHLQFTIHYYTLSFSELCLGVNNIFVKKYINFTPTLPLLGLWSWNLQFLSPYQGRSQPGNEVYAKYGKGS